MWANVPWPKRSQHRDKVLSQKQRITSAGAGILDRRAVAESDLTVLQDQHNGDGLTGLTNRLEALSNGSAHIEHAVVASALLDSALVVEVETGTAGRAF